MTSSAMNPVERRAAISLASLFAFRMLGMFMILPIFHLYGGRYADYSLELAGYAVGAYGLSQALLQIPFGLWSDRFGRKPVILAGLALFALGAVVAALSTSIYGVIAGRAIQGAGAIAGPVLALAADLSREEQRTKLMAVIGMAIGASFGLAQVLGPILAPVAGLAGVFWLTAAMAVLGMGLVAFAVPAPQVQSHEREVSAEGLRTVWRDGQLWRMHFGIFVLHFVMTGTLMTVPLLLAQGGLPAARHSWLYLAAMAGAILALGPLMRAARQGKGRSVLLACIALLALAELGFAASSGWDWHGLAALLLLFYMAFNYLEASLPSLMSRLAPASAKGAALGVYATAQFLGAALGGAGGGWLLHRAGAGALFLVCAGLVVLWLLSSRGLQVRRELVSHRLSVARMAPAEAELLLARLRELPGVRCANLADDAIHLQVEADAFDQETLAGLTSLG